MAVALRDSDTVFPRFDRNESADDSAEESVSSGFDELTGETSNGNQNASKENEDVAMFMSLAKKMSVKSLLFLLQNHARQMINVSEAQLNDALRLKSQEKNNCHGNEKPFKRQRIKKFRFAEILGGSKVREEVFQIPHVTEFEAEEKLLLWWNQDELLHMRYDARKAVSFFRKHRPDYCLSVELLAKSYLPDSNDSLVEDIVKGLAEHSFTRGLEFHIVDFLSDCRAKSQLAVLEEQQISKLCQQPQQPQQQQQQQLEQNIPAVAAENSNNQERIRGKYQVASLPCRTLACKIAQCDYIEALKASLSRWESGQ